MHIYIDRTPKPSLCDPSLAVALKETSVGWVSRLVGSASSSGH